ncbi:phospholipase D-like domain-containing protein [Neorhizobium sp. NCHU2750]|uniref:phospholipase D-like domain-containing protein n=1 Tax=Neorhizobium sp. NCHU2750 TaxID=1825976 RepID=UPI000E768F3D|nr:cardiolipin synthase [Neorhizobium sp. NCHU2750]
MIALIDAYWPHILFIISVVAGASAAIHATMTKEEVRSAVGWVGVVILSPIVGAALYMIAGVNRVRRTVIGDRRSMLAGAERADFASYDATDEQVIADFGYRFRAMKTLGDRVTRHHLTTGNDISAFDNGDAAYGAMIAAIGAAERSILLETYIFDRDRIGMRFVEALSAAVRRGVEVRVLIDAVGARYSVPSVLGMLKDGGVTVDVFNGNVIIGLRLPYANLRTHRKIMVIDGAIAFTGGMNIREAFSQELSGKDCAFDTHFRVTGPLVADLLAISAADWQFSTGERLEGEAWKVPVPEAETDIKPGSPVIARTVSSGPDRSIETNHKMLMGAFSIARSSIRIASPYFLPDRELITALITAARRGVTVDIVVPSANNLKLVDLAMTAQFDQMLKNYCRIWRASGSFNHSKLMAIDGCWSYVGSSNIDPRSLRLNFEVDLEVLDRPFAEALERRIDTSISSAEEVSLHDLRARPFAKRFLERVLWLASPYL